MFGSFRELFAIPQEEHHPHCHPSFPSMCKRRMKLLQKRQSSQYARELEPVCAKCLKATEGRYPLVVEMNDLIKKYL